MSKQELGPHQIAWIEALESGKYKQGNGQLRSRDQFYGQCDSSGDWTYDGELGIAPRTLIKHLGLRDENGSSTKFTGSWLTELNDEGKTFLEIAAIIRADPSIYFKEPR